MPVRMRNHLLVNAARLVSHHRYYGDIAYDVYAHRRENNARNVLAELPNRIHGAHAAARVTYATVGCARCDISRGRRRTASSVFQRDRYDGVGKQRVRSPYVPNNQLHRRA